MRKELDIVNIGNYMGFYKEKEEEKEYPPICREERQYALYLSNVLRYYGKESKTNNSESNSASANRIGNDEKVKIVEKVFEACGLDLDNIVVESVFYEATFMRDIFERNREKHFEKNNPILTEENKKHSFNLCLLEYCWVHCLQQENINELEELIADKIKTGEMKEVNYGARNEIPFLKEEIKERLTKEKFKKLLKGPDIVKIQRDLKYKAIVRAMMNAKPDLAVIYKDEGERKLLFLECKYLSKEDGYSYYTDINPETDKIILDKILQTEAQGYIADFLCNSYLKGCVEMSEIMKNNNESRIIRFVADPVKDEETQSKKGQTKSKQPEEHKIYIKDLIEVEKEIFDK